MMLIRSAVNARQETDSHLEPRVVVGGTAGCVFEPCQVVRCADRKWMKHESLCVDSELGSNQQTKWNTEEERTPASLLVLSPSSLGGSGLLFLGQQVR